jgi:hypothetical protein
VAHGNSVWSFAYLFLIAGFIKHHLTKLPTTRLLLITALTGFLLLASELFLGFRNDNIYLCWLNYNGLPFVLSVLVFMVFRQLVVSENKFWNLFVKLAPYTFGVYLIHDHLQVREWLWTTLSLPSYCNDLTYPFMVVGLCLVVFVVCATIEAIRKKLFAVLGVDALIRKVDRWTF